MASLKKPKIAVVGATGNVGREVLDIIDEKELVDALLNKEIAGAGLDVFETEPNIPTELKTLENVVSYPHLGSATIETRIAMGDTAINNALAYFDEKDLPNKVV